MSTARAQTPLTFTLDYKASPVSCPDKARFVEAIVERAPQAREVAPESASLRFAVHLEASEGPGALARGYVLVEQGDGRLSRRDVANAPCTEVAESMAVILSLILTESAPAESTVAPAGSAPDSAPAPVPGQPRAERAREAGPALSPDMAMAATDAEQRQPTTSFTVTNRRPTPVRILQPLRFGIALAALAETGVAPGMAFGGKGGVDLWLARNAMWSPSARLTARYVRNGLSVTDYGSARFRLAAMSAELCPVRWPVRLSTFGRLCALFDAGQLKAEPMAAAQGEIHSQTMPWIGGGGSLRVESTLNDTLSLEASANLVVLGRADRFTFEPGSHTVHQVPRASAAFSLGAVLRLP